MSDLVERLEACKFGLFWPEARDAIAEITRLQKALDTAREDALEEAARLIEQRNGSIPDRQEIAQEIRRLKDKEVADDRPRPHP